MVDEGQVREIGRGDLVEVDHGLKIVGRGIVEGCRGEIHTLGVGIVAELAILGLAEVVVLEEELVLRLRGFLGGVPVGG